MTAEAGFSSPEEMQQAYDQMWQDIADGISYVPSYFEEAVKFASENPVAVLVVTLFLILISCFFLRLIINAFSGRNR